MIRPYQIKDKPALLHLLSLNTPDYFDPSETADYIEYLDNLLESYFVFEENGNIIGAGGINFFPQEGKARISWDMIHPEHHGKGIGKKITLHRIAEIKKNPSIHTIVVRTSQLAFKFYEKCGFQLEKVEKDFWAEGFDLYQMKMGLRQQ